MGMRNSATIFQAAMEDIILKGLTKFIAYQDDILVFGKTEQNLRKHLNAIIGRLKSKNVSINEQKCVQQTQSIDFLGRTVTPDGVIPDASLVSKIVSINRPSDLKQLQSFLGLVGYFERFIQGFSEKIRHMQELKNCPAYAWSESCEKEFEAIKKELISAPVIKPFDEN